MSNVERIEVQRRVPGDAIPRSVAEVRQRPVQEGGDHRVRDHHALGHPRGAGGEEYVGCVVRGRLAWQGSVVLGGCLLGAERGCLDLQFSGQLCCCLAGQHHTWLCHIEDALHPYRWACYVDRHVHAACLQRCQHTHDRLRRFGLQQAHPVALLCAPFDQQSREAVAGLLEFCVGQALAVHRHCGLLRPALARKRHALVQCGRAHDTAARVRSKTAPMWCNSSSEGGMSRMKQPYPSST